MADRKVKKQEPVEIEYTRDLGPKGKPFIKAGQKDTVHAVQAEKLIEAGKAVKAGEAHPAPKQKGGKV